MSAFNYFKIKLMLKVKKNLYLAIKTNIISNSKNMDRNYSPRDLAAHFPQH